jgi:D-alanyl-D-alanine carboxypeptidase/D-alanyl-D-alanine-endopeptidase (penicillin-binding protein 4)
MALLAGALTVGATLGLARAEGPPIPSIKPTPPAPSAAELITRHGFRADQVGFALMDLENGRWLALHNPDGAFIPASVAKVPTTVAALDLLGPAYRWETRLATTGTIKDGVLDGDLYLVGQGDPVLDGSRLNRLMGGLARRGVTRVEGRFLYDDGFLASGPEIEPNQPDALSYNPGYGALSLDFNRLRLAWDPAQGPRMVEANQVPAIPDVRFRVAGAADGAWENLSVRFRYERPTTEIVAAALTPVAGPEEAPRESWLLAPDWRGKGGTWLPVKHPGAHMARVAREFAQDQGIALPEPRPGQAPAKARVLAETEGPPLVDVAARALRYSNNLVAELVGLTTSRRLTGEVLPLANSAAYLSDLFQRTIPGVDWSTFHLVNHSGLSSESRASPRQLVAILNYAQRHAFSGVDYAALLPRRGWRDEDGEMPAEADKPPIWAKTGTVYYGRGLSGFLVPPSGHLLAFALFTSDTAARERFDRENRHDDPAAVNRARAWLTRARALEQDLVLSWLAPGVPEASQAQ